MHLVYHLGQPADLLLATLKTLKAPCLPCRSTCCFPERGPRPCSPRRADALPVHHVLVRGSSPGGPPRCVELALARPLLRTVCLHAGLHQHHHVLPGRREEGSAWVFFSSAVPGRSYRCKTQKFVSTPPSNNLHTSGHLHRHTAVLEHLQTR
jgi:hypothetical protein